MSDLATPRDTSRHRTRRHHLAPPRDTARPCGRGPRTPWRRLGARGGSTDVRTVTHVRVNGHTHCELCDSERHAQSKSASASRTRGGAHARARVECHAALQPKCRSARCRACRVSHRHERHAASEKKIRRRTAAPAARRCRECGEELDAHVPRQTELCVACAEQSERHASERHACVVE